MENYVTPETAKKMKEAGFPQPEPRPGQMWFSAFHEIPSIVSHRTDRVGEFMLAPISRVDWSHIFFAGPIIGNAENIFMPTVADILRELPNKVLFWRNDDLFVCGVQMVDDGDYYAIRFNEVYKNVNPAESVAEVWLNRKPT